MFVLTRPQRVVYRVGGLPRLFLWLGQASSAAIAVWSVQSLQLRRFTGLQGTSDLLQGRQNIAEPETQTPDGEDGPYERGPFRWSRHPLEWAPLFLLWLTPTLKTNWLTFNAITSVYMLFGIWHEEKRLEAKGGQAYREYQKRVGLFWGRARS